jgi:hypothetical protein
LAIARQNRDRLLGFLSKDEQKAATVEEDRLRLTVLPQKNGRGAKSAKQVSLRLSPHESARDATGRSAIS